MAYPWQQVCERRDGKGKMTNVMAGSRGVRHKSIESTIANGVR
ncbi:MAG: hypothetical protein WBQ08_10830 [Candidatus Sulfotelmatobacter sp.]